MEPFAAHAAAFICEALDRLSDDERSSTQALSLWIWDIDHDARQATASLEIVGGPVTELWQGMVIDGMRGVLADPRDDPEGAALRDEWMHRTGVWFGDGDDDPTLVWDDRVSRWRGGITEAFVGVVCEAVGRLRTTGAFAEVLGRDVPVYIHEGRDHELAERWTQAANPGFSIAS